MRAEGKLFALAEKIDGGNAIAVHNGIIENYQELKVWLEKRGIPSILR